MIFLSAGFDHFEIRQQLRAQLIVVVRFGLWMVDDEGQWTDEVKKNQAASSFLPPDGKSGSCFGTTTNEILMILQRLFFSGWSLPVPPPERGEALMEEEGTTPTE